MGDIEQNRELSRLESSIDRMEGVSDDLLLLMESQSRAVVHSDADGLESLTEKQMELTTRFRNEKEQMEEEVRELLSRRSDPDGDARWSRLMERYPEYLETLQEWRDRLKEKTDRVDRRQKQVFELLAFARNHNERLLKTLFRKQNQEKGSYLKSGQQIDSPSGMTINREV